MPREFTKQTHRITQSLLMIKEKNFHKKGISSITPQRCSHINIIPHSANPPHSAEVNSHPTAHTVERLDRRMAGIRKAGFPPNQSGRNGSPDSLSHGMTGRCVKMLNGPQGWMVLGVILMINMIANMGGASSNRSLWNYQSDCFLQEGRPDLRSASDGAGVGRTPPPVNVMPLPELTRLHLTRGTTSNGSSIPTTGGNLEEQWSEECEAKGQVYVRDTVLDPKLAFADGRRIPRIVQVTSKSRCVPKIYADGLDKWRFPDHSFFFHDDVAMKYLIYEKEWPEFPNLRKTLKCIEHVKPGVVMADIWRLLAIYEYGGIYTDIDNIRKLGQSRTMLAVVQIRL
jgi:hypothetical protein